MAKVSVTESCMKPLNVISPDSHERTQDMIIELAKGLDEALLRLARVERSREAIGALIFAFDGVRAAIGELREEIAAVRATIPRDGASLQEE